MTLDNFFNKLSATYECAINDFNLFDSSRLSFNAKLYKKQMQYNRIN